MMNGNPAELGSVDPRPGSQEMALRNRQSLKVADRSILWGKSCQGLEEKLLKETQGGPRCGLLEGVETLA